MVWMYPTVFLCWQLNPFLTVLRRAFNQILGYCSSGFIISMFTKYSPLAIRHICGQLEVTSWQLGTFTVSSQGQETKHIIASDPRDNRHSYVRAFAYALWSLTHVPSLMNHRSVKGLILPSPFSFSPTSPRGCLCLPIPINLPRETCCMVWFVPDCTA